jgi:hypothetical protein
VTRHVIRAVGQRVTPVLIVPASAIVFNDDSLHVLMARNGIAHLRARTPRRAASALRLLHRKPWQ